MYSKGRAPVQICRGRARARIYRSRAFFGARDRTGFAAEIARGFARSRHLL